MVILFLSFFVSVRLSLTEVESLQNRSDFAFFGLGLFFSEAKKNDVV
jgi:hypothetical protein